MTDRGLVVVVQDEASPSEGAGARLVRYFVDGEHARPSDLVDASRGPALAEIALGGDGGWLAWKDESDRAFVAPWSPSAEVAGAPSAEPALDGARVLAASADGQIYAVAGSELRRLSCTR